MQITIRTNFPDVRRQLEALRAEVADRATARALNRTIEQARTAMSREIRQEFAVDAKTVREKLRIKRATFKAGVLGLQAALEADGRKRSANLIRFGARMGATGLTVKIKRTGGRKRVANAFIGNKGRTVFERIPGTKMSSRRYGGKHGERIKPVQTIDVAQMFNTRRINAAVVAVMQARFPAIFQRELAFALSRFNA